MSWALVCDFDDGVLQLFGGLVRAGVLLRMAHQEQGEQFGPHHLRALPERVADDAPEDDRCVAYVFIAIFIRFLCPVADILQEFGILNLDEVRVISRIWTWAVDNCEVLVAVADVAGIAGEARAVDVGIERPTELSIL